MRVFLGDKFMECLIKLPKTIQKKAIELPKKLEQSPELSGLNIEKIITFKDPSLRTVRVDQKYRGIISLDLNKNVAYLLWVDNHDEAMNWAQNRRFEWNEHTNAPQLFSVDETDISIETPERQPVEPRFSDLTLRKIGVPEPLIVKARKIQNYDDLSKLESQLPTDAFEHIFYLLDGADEKKLLEELEENLQKDKSGNTINFNRFFIEVNDDILEEMLTGSFEKWMLFLHPTQQKTVFRDFNGSVKVTGGAGTGKTVAALHRLKFLAQQKKDSRKITFLTYTSALRNNLEKQIKQLQVNEEHYVLSTLDKLALDLAKEFRLIEDSSSVMYGSHGLTPQKIWEEVLETEVTEFTSEALHQETQQVILFYDLESKLDYLKQSRIGMGSPLTKTQRKEVWALYERYQEIKKERKVIDRLELFNKVAAHLLSVASRPYSHVIVDEIQDCSNVEVRFIRSLTEESSNDLFLVGDPYQAIYERRVNFYKSGVNIRGKRSFQMKVNYRTTEEIRKFAMTTLDGVNYDDFDGNEEKLNGYVSLFHGQEPVYQTFDSKEEEISFIIEYIKGFVNEQELRFNDIVIATRTKDGLKDITSELHHSEIPYRDLRKDTGDLLGVRLSTFHSLKGLEFKVVFLADVSSQTLPYQHSGYRSLSDDQRERYHKEERSLFYVASTRAIKALLVSGVGEKSSILTR